MNKYFLKQSTKGFTLIELLIVVAIIAILAAIAVPNFLEAQTRSKVARTLADMRTLRTGLESYRVDNTTYPETDDGVGGAANNVGLVTGTTADFFDPPSGFRSIFRLTTPISYLTSFPTSPWKENYGAANGDIKIASAFETYLYVRRKASSGLTDNIVGETDQNYLLDRRYYLYGNDSDFSLSNSGTNGPLNNGEWHMKSAGPDAIDNSDASHPEVDDRADARVYDASNGTVSAGDIVIFSDTNEPSQRDIAP